MSGLYDELKESMEEVIADAKGEKKCTRHRITVLPPDEVTAMDIKLIRNNLQMSQVTFASAMGVSKKTVEAWEAGRNRPDGAARRLLGNAKRDPKVFNPIIIE